MAIHKFTGWEKAPKGATHFCVQDVFSPWLRRDGEKEQFYFHDKWVSYDYTPHKHFIGAIERYPDVWKNAPADATHYTKQAGGRFLKVAGDAVFYSVGKAGQLHWKQYDPDWQMDIARQRLENAVPRPVNEKQEKVMFKVGDQVRVICDHPIGGWGLSVKKGDVGVVSEVRDNGRMLVDFPNHHNWVGRPKEFELVAPAKKVYTLADLKGTGLDAQLKACAVDARTLRKLRDRVVYNLNNMEIFLAGDEEKGRLDNINSTFRWAESPEGWQLWAKVFYKRQVKFEDIPPKPRGKKAQVEQAPAAPAQPRADVPLAPPPANKFVKIKAPEAPAPEKKAEAPVNKQPVKKVGWW